MVLMFTHENTEGYNDSELEILNFILHKKLCECETDDEREEVKKTFADDVSRMQNIEKYPCDNCDRVIQEDDEIVTMIPGLEHYFCSSKCALEFTERHLVKKSAFHLKVYGRDD